MNTSSIRSGFRPHNKPSQQNETRLSFLRPENFLPPSHKRQVPITAHQIQDLLRWSGNNQKEMASYLNCSLQAFRIWGKTSRSISDNKIIPSTIWHYMAIILGLKSQPEIRRVEPSTTIKHTYDSASNQPVSFRAHINYHMNQISIHNDSAIAQITGDSIKPLIVIDVNFETDQEKELIMINGMLRTEACPWTFEGSNTLTKNLNDFLQNHIWTACWRLHDYYSLQPSMFLEPKHLLPMHNKKARVPNSTALLRFCRWLGATPADLAVLIWEQPDYMRFLVSPKAKEELEEAKKLYQITDGDSKEEIAHKKKQLFNKTMRCKISPQGWQILLSASGLGASIPVIGQSDPRPRHEKLLTIREVGGVPMEYVKIKCVSDWADTTKSKIVITYQVSSHEKRGVEKKVTFDLSEHNGIFELEGKLMEEGAPEVWTKTFEVEGDGYENKKDIVNWFNKALWRYNWKFINLHKLK